MDRFKKYLHDKYKLTDAQWNLIKDYFEIITVPKNEYFVRPGKVCYRIGFIVEGVMRFCMERDGEDITCYFACENNFSGDYDSFISRKPSERRIQALTDCVLIGINYDNLQKVFLVFPHFKEIMKLIDHDVLMGLMLQRDFLQHADAASKYQKFTEQYPHILQRVPLSYIASFLGITQQSLSRLRKQIS